ncbi:MAG TPA: D-tyrosyl-tRNA(Tyr) deacylase [Candidatus Ligilactobacillus excrementigallinarum]|uniref:D-aminoacyl-tRNA deacylase n=1 Tax=Candidatus Ligilactobacillus excrementigallinarum TaxID=2838641 RepID=A0A9D1UWR9_9LACO|nr:D-tyrosyl-tRNA(Tyr) deacylase [Candidatus Ligilactobacillus excrementigallinarum]
MRVVLQRVKHAKVSVDNRVIGKINHGYLLLVGFTHEDGNKEIDYLARKIANARLFNDENGKINLSVKDVDGQILSVSQFTLFAETKKGNRPSFTKAQTPAIAKENYNKFNQKLQEYGLTVETGEFGADMQVELINDGPITIIYDTNQK